MMVTTDDHHTVDDRDGRGSWSVTIIGVVHAWVGQILLKCNEFGRILRDRGKIDAGARSAAAGVHASCA